MTLFLGLLSLALCIFIGILFYFDLAPKYALNKVLRRFFPAFRTLRPPSPAALYSRGPSVPGAIPAHNPILLNLSTSDGSGQACHPDVVYLPEGFGAKNWTHWMVCTPYPFADSAFENPELFVSYDGLHWSIPDGLHNPLAPTPGNVLDHNSDPDLLFHEDRLWLFYRETLRSMSPTVNTIYLLQSSDGLSWSSPMEVLRDNSGSHLLSPALLHDGDSFWMWTVEIHNHQLTLMRRRSADGIHWPDPPEVATLLGLEEGRKPWHIDVIADEHRLSAILVSCTQFGGSDSRIHYAYSTDGLTWAVGPFLLDQSYEFEKNLQYRASLRKISGRHHEYQLWYSAASPAGVFSIAFVRLVRRENNLFPVLQPSAQPETLTALQ